MQKILLLVLLAWPSLALCQSPAPATGLEGLIMISPAMGGPTRQGADNSKPLPNTKFLVKQEGKVVTTFETDKEGHFQVPLSPGHYSIVKKEKSVIGSYGPFEADVAAGEMKTVRWMCDSGIR